MVGEEQLLLQVSSPLQQLQIGLMVILLVRYLLLIFYTFSLSLSSLLVHLTLEAFPVFNLTYLLTQSLLLAMQMKMKSTFGAFLDPVADKVTFFS